MECLPGENISERDLVFAVFVISQGAEGAQRWKDYWGDGSSQIPTFIITDYSEIASLLPENVGGALIIQGNSNTSLSPEDFRTRVEFGIRQSFLLSYNGFYVDNIFNTIPLTTLIKEVSPLLYLQLASNSQEIQGRSFWLRRSYFFDAISYQLPGNCQGFFLEAQFYPSLVINRTPRPTPSLSNFWALIVIGLLILIAIIFWLYCLIW